MHAQFQAQRVQALAQFAQRGRLRFQLLVGLRSNANSARPANLTTESTPHRVNGVALVMSLR
jgi:hypothetical protein